MDFAVKMTDSGGDIVISSKGDIVLGNPIIGMTFVSLFCDERARIELVENPEDLRGYWGNEGEPYGSLIWTLFEEKMTQETLTRLEDYISSALQHLVTKEICAEIDVFVARIGLQSAEALVRLKRGTNEKWDRYWDFKKTEEYNFNENSIKVQLVA